MVKKTKNNKKINKTNKKTLKNNKKTQKGGLKFSQIPGLGKIFKSKNKIKYKDEIIKHINNKSSNNNEKKKLKKFVNELKLEELAKIMSSPFKFNKLKGLYEDKLLKGLIIDDLLKKKTELIKIIKNSTINDDIRLNDDLLKWKLETFIYPLSKEEIEEIEKLNNTQNKIKAIIDLYLKKKEKNEANLKLNKVNYNKILDRPTDFLYFDVETLPSEILLKRYFIENIFKLTDEVLYILELMYSLFFPNDSFKFQDIYFDGKFVFDLGNAMKSKEDEDSSSTRIDKNFIDLLKKIKINKINNKSLNLSNEIGNLNLQFISFLRDIRNIYLQINIKNKLRYTIERYNIATVELFLSLIVMCKLLISYLEYNSKKVILRNNNSNNKSILNYYLKGTSNFQAFYETSISVFLSEFKNKIGYNEIETNINSNTLSELVKEKVAANTSNNINKINDPSTILRFSSDLEMFQKIKLLYDTYYQLKEQVEEYRKTKNINQNNINSGYDNNNNNNNEINCENENLNDNERSDCRMKKIYRNKNNNNIFGNVSANELKELLPTESNA